MFYYVKFITKFNGGTVASMKHCPVTERKNALA